MVTLSLIHWVYLLMVFIVIITMGLRRDTVLPCIVGLFVIGYTFSGKLVAAVQVTFNALVAAGVEFQSIIVVISLVVAMSKAMSATGIDALIAKPATRLMVNPDVAFWVMGFGMLIVSWFVWPSPGVALIGVLLLPVAVKAGLPAIGAAVAMNLFGHGVALSSDWIIQGAPGITAKAAGLQDATQVTYPGIPLYLVMSVVTIVIAYILLKRDLVKNKEKHQQEALTYTQQEDVKPARSAGFFAVLIPLAFFIDVIALLVLDLVGGDATALIGGTALLLMSLISIVEFRAEALEKVTEFIRDGFMFGIKIFAPVIVIGAFFFLGSEETAKSILGENASGLLTDIGLYLSQKVPLSKAPIAFIQMIIGGVTGLDGSGFSGLPLVGSLAQTFGKAINGNIGVLGALGQISAVWVGGGTIIPWGIIPVAAICGVEPMDLARRNFMPVIIGLLVTTLFAIFFI